MIVTRPHGEDDEFTQAERDAFELAMCAKRSREEMRKILLTRSEDEIYKLLRSAYVYTHCAEPKEWLIDLLFENFTNKAITVALRTTHHWAFEVTRE